jgi:MarR family transcriptional regulator, 2-MHQ and catechol-resistance regulon repressor
MASNKAGRTSRADLRRDAEALHSALTQLVRLYQFRDRDKICCHDVSITQCNALEVLVERGPLRSQALAAALMLDKSTTTRVVDALVRKGYVERRADPADARALALSVTQEGRLLHARISGELIEQQVEILRDLEPDIRSGAAEVVRRLARAAQERFKGDTMAAACAPACMPDAGKGRA